MGDRSGGGVGNRSERMGGTSGTGKGTVQTGYERLEGGSSVGCLNRRPGGKGWDPLCFGGELGERSRVGGRGPT